MTDKQETNQKFTKLFNAGLIQIENKFNRKHIEYRWNILNTVKQLTAKEVANAREKREV